MPRERWLTIDLDDGTAWIYEPDALVIRREGDRICLAFGPQRIPPA